MKKTQNIGRFNIKQHIFVTFFVRRKKILFFKETCIFLISLKSNLAKKFWLKKFKNITHGPLRSA